MSTCTNNIFAQIHSKLFPHFKHVFFTCNFKISKLLSNVLNVLKSTIDFYSYIFDTTKGYKLKHSVFLSYKRIFKVLIKICYIKNKLLFFFMRDVLGLVNLNNLNSFSSFGLNSFCMWLYLCKSSNT